MHMIMCVLCIFPYILSGSPNESCLHTCNTCIIKTWRLRLWAPLVACNNAFTYFLRLKLKASRHWLYPWALLWSFVTTKISSLFNPDSLIACPTSVSFLMKFKNASFVIKFTQENVKCHFACRQKHMIILILFCKKNEGSFDAPNVITASLFWISYNLFFPSFFKFFKHCNCNIPMDLSEKRTQTSYNQY